MKTKMPKRIKAWVNVYGSNIGYAHSSRRAARANRTPRATRVDAVPLVELRRGEVVVEVFVVAAEIERGEHEEVK